MISEESLWKLYQANGQNAYATARELNIDHSSCAARIRRIKAKMTESSTIIPSEVDVDEVVSRRKSEYERRHDNRKAKQTFKRRIKTTGPFGILVMGDPHNDDPACDLDQCDADQDIAAETDGMYLACVGDITNNWSGRLIKLYANQSTTSTEAVALTERFLTRVPPEKWLVVIGGNHESMTVHDPLALLCKQAGVFYVPNRLRMTLQCGQDGNTERRIAWAHGFNGKSMWNPAHGVGREGQLGVRDHVLIGGHTHQSGVMVLRDPDTNRVIWAVQVSTYKSPELDEFGDKRNLRSNHLSPSVTLIFDPSKPESNPDHVSLFWSASAGAEYLTWLRSKWNGNSA